MRLAVASKSCHWPWFGALRAALAPHGIDLISRWIDWPRNQDGRDPTPAEWRDHSVDCIEDAARCQVLLLYCAEPERQFGALLECGSALSHGRQVFVVTPHDWPFLKNHPSVRVFPTLEAAVSCLIAMATGERLRIEDARVDGPSGQTAGGSGRGNGAVRSIS
jgi:hypothetical protein